MLIGKKMWTSITYFNYTLLCNRSFQEQYYKTTGIPPPTVEKPEWSELLLQLFQAASQYFQHSPMRRISRSNMTFCPSCSQSCSAERGRVTALLPVASNALMLHFYRQYRRFTRAKPPSKASLVHGRGHDSDAAESPAIALVQGSSPKPIHNFFFHLPCAPFCSRRSWRTAGKEIYRLIERFHRKKAKNG